MLGIQVETLLRLNRVPKWLIGIRTIHRDEALCILGVLIQEIVAALTRLQPDICRPCPVTHLWNMEHKVVQMDLTWCRRQLDNFSSTIVPCTELQVVCVDIASIWCEFAPRKGADLEVFNGQWTVGILAPLVRHCCVLSLEDDRVEDAVGCY